MVPLLLLVWLAHVAQIAPLIASATASTSQDALPTERRLSNKTEVSPSLCTFVAISDTHNKHGALGRLPDADVLIVAGDFTKRGRVSEVEPFVSWLVHEQAHIPQKIVIPGNHELSLGGLIGKSEMAAALELLTNAEARAAGIELLIGESTRTRVGGFLVFGSPVTPEYFGAFNRPPETIGAEWARIPSDADVVVTHGPARGHGDAVHGAGHVGCPVLLQELLARVRPTVAIAGHIHEGRGLSTEGGVTFLNVATCNVAYEPVHPPAVFSLARPHAQADASVASDPELGPELPPPPMALPSGLAGPVVAEYGVAAGGPLSGVAAEGDDGGPSFDAALADAFPEAPPATPPRAILRVIKGISAVVRPWQR